MHIRHSSVARYGNYALCVFACLFTVAVGCAKSTVERPAASVTVEANRKLTTAPHRYDVYRPQDANKAIVFLHGGGGTKESIAYELGLKFDPTGVDYRIRDAQILVDNHAIAVFPQGQAVPASPGSRTWSNYVMTSGQNDVQFLRDLVAFIKAQYKVSELYVVGHSNGAMMVNRIWCEAPELFDGYVAISGPPSEHFLSTPCSPATAKPFLSILGAQDDVLQNSIWAAQKWTIDPALVQASGAAFVDPVVIGARYFLPIRVALRCSGTVQVGDADAIQNGTTAKWSMCGGSIQLIRVESGGHGVDELEAALGSKLLNLVMNFINAQP